MKLEKIYLSRRWSSSSNEFSGKVGFKGDLGEIELNLSSEQCEKVIAICAEQLVKTSKALAEEMTAKCIDVQTTSINLIEG